MQRLYYPSSLHAVEDVEEYRPGGYHPVHLGDVFHGTYKVLHKLGAGGFSTTWLARDIDGKRYVALKILKADETPSGSELGILERLRNVQNDHPGRKHIRTLAAHFTIQGPNGLHNCIVTEVGGPSLNELYNVPGCGYVAGARRLRADIAHHVSRQVVEAVHFLHSQQLCHGDLTIPNLLFKLQPIDKLSEEEVYSRFGHPVKEALLTVSKSKPGASAPEYIVKPANVPDAKFLTHDILLIDLGEACPFGSPPRPQDIGTPFMYRAPESVFDSRYDQYSDVWSLGCVLFEIRAGSPLFASIMGGRDEIIQQMVQMKGKLPEPWWSSWDKRSICFDEDGKPLKHWPKGRVMAQEYPIEDMIAEIGSEDEDIADRGPCASMLEPSWTRVPQDEAESMRDFLEGVLRWVPEERTSIEEIRRHPWITG